MARKTIKPDSAPGPDDVPVSLVGVPEMLRGVYSNVILVHHTKEEMVLDFLFSATGQAHLVSRIILSPDHAERLVKALTENIAKFKSRVERRG